MENETELLTCAQVAEMKKVHLRSVYRAIKEDRLKATKYGDIWLVRREDAGRWRGRSGRYNE